MALFNWSRKYSVGIKIIDDQHIRLFAIINTLHDSIVKKKSDPDIVKEILNELVSYTLNHFRFEENLLNKHNFFGKENHIADHNKLIEDLRSLIHRYENGEYPVIEELLTFTIEWLQNHILITDKNYSSFLIEKGVT